MTRKHLGMITTVVLDSPIEECAACGLLEGPYDAPVRLDCESRSLKSELFVDLDSREAITALADQISAVTGIARRDVVL